MWILGYIGRVVNNSGAVVRTSDSQSREPGFEYSFCCFEACAINFVHSTLHQFNQLCKFSNSSVAELPGEVELVLE